MKKLLALVLALIMALPVGISFAEDEPVPSLPDGPLILAPERENEGTAADLIKSYIDLTDQVAVIAVFATRDKMIDAISGITIPESWNDIILPETAGELANTAKTLAVALVMTGTGMINEKIEAEAVAEKEEIANQAIAAISEITTFNVPETIAQIELYDTLGDEVEYVLLYIGFDMGLKVLQAEGMIEQAGEIIKEQIIDCAADAILSQLDFEIPEEIADIAFADIKVRVRILPAPANLAVVFALPDELIEALPDTVGEFADLCKLMAADIVRTKTAYAEELVDGIVGQLKAKLEEQETLVFNAIINTPVPEKLYTIKLAETVGDLVDSLKVQAIDLVTGEANAAMAQIDEKADQLKEAVNSVGETVTDYVMSLSVPENIAGIPLPESVGAFAENTLGTVCSVVNESADEVADKFDAAAEYAKDLVDHAFEQIQEKVQNNSTVKKIQKLLPGLGL